MAEPTPPVEPDTDAPLPGAEPDTDEAADDEEREAQSPAQAAAAQGSADIPKKLERAVTDQRKRLERIIGVDLEGKECPTCDGMGYIPQGTDDEAAPVHPDNLVMCDACNGWGEVLTGSRNASHITTVCITCAGNGFVTKPSEVAAVVPIAQPQYQPAAGQMGTLLPTGEFVPLGAAQPAPPAYGAS